jgi:hypothetical protein
MPNLALTPSQKFPIQASISSNGSPKTPFISTPLASPSLSNISGLPQDPETIAKNVDKVFVVYTTVEVPELHMNMPMGTVNQASWHPQQNPPFTTPSARS